jgi:outer membrane protein insertion porin family
MRIASLFFVTAALTVTFAGAALSQTLPGTGGPAPANQQALTVAAIEIDGLVTVDSGRVLRTLAIEPGDALTASVLRDAQKRLWRLQVFDDVWIQEDARADGVHLIVHVVERPRISAVEFRGNDRIDSEDLLKKSGLAVGQRLSTRSLAAAQDSIVRFYREKGFVTAAVDQEVSPQGLTERIVIFEITEGEQARVSGFEFPGGNSFSYDELRDQMKSGTKGFLRSGKVDPEKLQEDAQRLRAFYRNNGFKDVIVDQDSMVFSPDGKRITLVYRIDEGQRYRIGEIHWEGQQSLDDHQVRLLPQPLEGDYYDQSAIRQTVEAAYSHYAELGYLYVSVDPVERIVEPGVVDITFRFQEGGPSRLRQIHITGNTYTKEKVVRRELAIREGDRFSRTLLMRSQQNMFRLGFFEDVQVDFRPADSSDVDLYFKVKEKRGGTASAGAGFSSESGLTGFIQLGHNNLFGNGQAVNIQLERGARRNTINLSFTDPWFLDTRTTFGASIFTRERITAVFASGSGGQQLEIRETRRGGSLRLGRPLFFMDFARGFITYRIENVKQSVNAQSNQSLDDAELELRNQIVPSQTTSSVTFSLIRDSRNNPFYPSGGSRIIGSAEYAGKLLGGDVRFQKYELDSRLFFPSIIRGIATMIRWRGGVISGWGDGVPVPDYERYRLGGTTFYGLRGYEDFEIVPQENISLVDGIRFAYPGGRWMTILTLEQQFPIANPLRGLLFVSGGNTWNSWDSIEPFQLKKSAGFGFRLEVPMLGNLGLDFGYGFDRFPRPGWRTHFLLGNMVF